MVGLEPSDQLPTGWNRDYPHPLNAGVLNYDNSCPRDLSLMIGSAGTRDPVIGSP